MVPMEQLNKAMAIGQLCWNLALQPENERDLMISEMRPGLNMDEDLFAEFRRSIIDPMIRRHLEMFPFMHQRASMAGWPSEPSPRAHPRAAAGEAYPGTEPYAPCPCKSGEKYKFCCRKKGH